MQIETNEKFSVLVQLIKEVKPSIVDKTVNLEDSLTDDLGLDSLDLLQLSRKVRRKLDDNFNLDGWTDSLGTQKRTVSSLLAVIATEVAEG